MGEHTQANRTRTGRPDHRRHIGQLGEALAADYLTGLGWRILDRNWRTRYGEVDLLAADGSALVVVEVKTRASRTFTDPAAAVTPAKLRTMRLVTRQWLAEQDRFWPIIRFDIVSVQLDLADPDDVERAALTHHRGVVE